ncbi:helix-turn-helix domain-containing protein [Streptomyces sp. NPDC093260]|uniref:helix-turn-helix domain-containing protein n=1 Tax=Streptomyces sp. NPDC093260 TaxID=3155073 RepID=UPI00342AA6BC
MSARQVPNTRFSLILRNARKRAGMTQRQLAELSTISVRAIRDLELAYTGTPRTQTIRLLADALRLSKARRVELEAAAGLVPGHALRDELPAPQAPLGPLIAREREAATLVRLLRSPDHRLVKVAGMPGTGKSSLIRKVVSDLHRTEFVPVICLDRTSDSTAGRPVAWSGLIRRVAELIRCEPTLDDVAGTLARNEVLLTVDGRDLDDRDRQDLTVLVQWCQGLRVLYETCETAANSIGESVLSVAPLGVPDLSRPGTDSTAVHDYPAVRYMTSRCAQFHPEAMAHPEALTAIAGICWYLDGIPAALDSAASWLLIYEPAELLEMAETSPVRLTASPSGESNPLIAWLRRALESLLTCEFDALRWLASAQPWTLADAAGLLGDSTADAQSVIHALYAGGLIRRVKSVPGEPTRFVVLNLVRDLYRSEYSDMESRVSLGA